LCLLIAFESFKQLKIDPEDDLSCTLV